MSVKLGVAPIAWSNDDMPELGGETTLEQCLKEANEAGYIGIESGGKFPKKSSELIPKLDQFNLKLCSGWYGANLRKNSVEEEKKSIQEQLDLFKDCDAPCIVFAEVSGSIQGDPNRKLSKRYSKILKTKTINNPSVAYKDKDVKAIFIASTTSTHIRFILDGIKNRKIIFCEKPLDLSIKKIESCKKKN